MQVVLFEPEIPPNTGNIVRLCAATAVPLHLIEPLGFSLEDRYLRRAGLDYWPHVELHVWPHWTAYATQGQQGGRLVLTSSRRDGTETPVQHFAFLPDDCLVLGPETRGLPPDIWLLSPYHVRIPMREGGVRCLNLSTAAGILLYQALARTGLLDTW